MKVVAFSTILIIQNGNIRREFNGLRHVYLQTRATNETHLYQVKSEEGFTGINILCNSYIIFWSLQHFE